MFFKEIPQILLRTTHFKAACTLGLLKLVGFGVEGIELRKEYMPSPEKDRNFWIWLKLIALSVVC